MIQATLPLLRTSLNPRIVNLSRGAGSHGDEAFGLFVARDEHNAAVGTGAIAIYDEWPK
jgi:hypothetical protein